MSTLDPSGQSRRRKRLPNIVPAWEKGNAVRQFARGPTAALPVVAEDGKVKRVFPTARRSSKRSAVEAGIDVEGTGEGKVAGTGNEVKGLANDANFDRGRPRAKRSRGASKGRGDARDFAAEMEKLEQAKAQIAAMASAVVANPEGNLAHLSELRKLAKSSNRSITTLVVLTESQLYKDICPAYRIRTVTEEEASVKISKDVAQLRNYEQGLLTAYTRFIRSVVSLSKWSGGSTSACRGGSASTKRNWTDAEKKMHKLRRAACTALCEAARHLLHFNLASDVASAVAGLTCDRDPVVRKEAADALSEVMEEAHKCAGTSLSSRVLVADLLCKAVVHGKGLAQAETIEPLLKIRFSFFSKFDKSAGKKEPKKPFNRKHRTKMSSAQADKAAKEAAEKEKQERLDLERDMKEAHAEATPQELFAAKKSLLNSVCKACFNVIKVASESALSAAAATKANRELHNGTDDGASSTLRRTRKPPPGLAGALEGTLLVATMLQSDLVDAILAALNPILEGDTLPLMIRFRSLAAAYAILAAHAAEQKLEADAFTRDARAMDACLYTALGQLYGPSSPLSADESVTAEALRAISAAISGRRMPTVRIASFARRMAIAAATLAPTHACAAGLLSATQVMLPVGLVDCIFSSETSARNTKGGEGSGENDASRLGAVGDFGEGGGLVQDFVFSTEDPDTAGAEHSAAWELAALTSYFHPTVQATARLCCSGVCGDRRPTGGIDATTVLESHTSAKGGFNPPPQASFKGRKQKSKASRLHSLTALDPLLASLGDKFRLSDLEKDEEFPALAFSSCFESQ